MNKIRRYYNQNRKKIWGIIIIIAFAFAIQQAINFYIKNQNEKEINNLIAKSSTNNNSAISENKQTSNNTATQTTQTDIKEATIKQFVNYCNKKELENAYNMLTDECKEQMFNDLEKFTQIYYGSAFENRAKEAIINKWSNNTYLVYLKENALSTGRATDDNQKGDYITVVKNDDGNYRLNVNSYVGYEQINKTKEENEIKIEVVCKNAYMNYEEYKLIVTNKSNMDITLDTLYSVDTIFIEDVNGTKYSSYSHELSKELLTITKGHTRELNIKFYNSYSAGRKIKTLVFSDLWKGLKKLNFDIDL